MTEWLKVIDCKSIEYYSSQVRILFSSFLIDKHFWLCIRLQILKNEFDSHINLVKIYEHSLITSLTLLNAYYWSRTNTLFKRTNFKSVASPNSAK